MEAEGLVMKAAEHSLLTCLTCACRQKLALQIVHAFGDETQDKLDLVRAHMTATPDNAPYWLSTTHKVKGLERSHVQLADDFVKEMRLSVRPFDCCHSVCRGQV